VGSEFEQQEKPDWRKFGSEVTAVGSMAVQL